MEKTDASYSDAALGNLDALPPDLEALYKDVHSHPELSMQETRTAGIAADRLRTPAMRSRLASARRVSSACCAMARGRLSCCVPTWMRCPSRKRRA